MSNQSNPTAEREAGTHSGRTAAETDARASLQGSDALVMNVSTNERILSLFAGSAITLLGLRQRSNFGAILAAVGGMMIYRGTTGHCPIYSALGTDTPEPG